MINRIIQFLEAERLIDHADGRLTVWIGKKARESFLQSLPIDMRAIAAAGSKGFVHKGVVYVFDDDATYADAVVKLNGEVCGRVQ